MLIVKKCVKGHFTHIPQSREEECVHPCLVTTSEAMNHDTCIIAYGYAHWDVSICMLIIMKQQFCIPNELVMIPLGGLIGPSATLLRTEVLQLINYMQDYA
jgi:hypothetical protein